MLIALLVLYSPMLLPKAPAKLARRLGAAEYLFGHLRDHTFGVVNVFLAAYTQQPVFVLGAALAAIAYMRHVHAGLALTEFMRANPTVHPQEFFDRYYDRLGPNRVAPPAHASRTIDPASVDFTTGAAPIQSKRPLWRALYDTGIFARSAYRALTVAGPGYGRECFDAMATLWGSRVLQLFRSRLTVNGIDALKQLDGKIVLAFTHKSHLDFVFAFFALSTARRKDGRRIRVRYIAAKDHFLDNEIVYEWLGVGKLIEAVDMVFVDRKNKGKDAIDDAAKKLASLPIEIAIFPQGTRARAHYGVAGERRDAGYYTVGPLKKGAAHLAIGTAATHETHVACFGIDGTATLVPKGAFDVQTETHVHFELGGIFEVRPDTPIDEIQARIDAHLRRATQIDELLTERLLHMLPVEDAMRIGELSPRVLADIDAACSLPGPEQRRAALVEIGHRVLAEIAANRGRVRSIEATWSNEARP